MGSICGQRPRRRANTRTPRSHDFACDKPPTFFFAASFFLERFSASALAALADALVTALALAIVLNYWVQYEDGMRAKMMKTVPKNCFD